MAHSGPPPTDSRSSMNAYLAQVTVSVEVPARAADGPGGLLPHTGLDIAIFVLAAAVLIAAGWLALRLDRRKAEVDNR